MLKSLTVLAVFLLLINLTHGWSASEMQMFDLVEELKMTFYDFLGVEETASNGEIRRAYRKLSLSMHPDKNADNPEAQKKFRQLVGVYEVLKDDELRKQYDDVLVNGLPSWKTPVFYLRKVRKMSSFEIGALFIIFATLIHYAVLWGSVYEKRLTMEDKLSSAYKRHKASGKKLEQVNLEIANQLKSIETPTWKETLPFALVNWCIAFLSGTYLLSQFFYYQACEFIKMKTEERRESKEIEKAMIERREKKRRQKTESDPNQSLNMSTDGVVERRPTKTVEKTAKTTTPNSKVNA